MNRQTTVIAAVAAMLWLTACQTVWDPVVNVTAVEAAGMRTWAELSVAGKTTPEFDARVTEAHNRFREAARVAKVTLEAYQAGRVDRASYLRTMEAVRVLADQVLDIIWPAAPQAVDGLKMQLTEQ